MPAAKTPEHEAFMRRALDLADEAERSGEVPVGAVVVQNGEVIGCGSNAPIASADPTAHAEVLALREASRSLNNYRLSETTLYVTLEPCAMCAGALVAARVDRLVFGARDLRFGAVRSKFRIADSDLLNHRVKVVEGILADECLRRLRRFFRAARVSVSKRRVIGQSLAEAPGSDNVGEPLLDRDDQRPERL